MLLLAGMGKGFLFKIYFFHFSLKRLRQKDRLDTPLTVGQMQGKFQLTCMPQAGHAIHEDQPIKGFLSFKLSLKLILSRSTYIDFCYTSSPGEKSTRLCAATDGPWTRWSWSYVLKFFCISINYLSLSHIKQKLSKLIF